MRSILVVAALLTCVGAGSIHPPRAEESVESHSRSYTQGHPSETICRDRIHAVRAERGLPKLDREPVSAEEPLLIAAIDRRIDGCSVLVMRHDTSDVRPIPKPDGRSTLRPAR